MELADEILAGAVDMHVHNHMMEGYRWNLVELANQAIEAKMGGIVLKDRYGASSEMAYLVNHLVGKEILFGSLVLNGWVGGLNPTAVEGFANYGGGIRIVSMPTGHSVNHLRLSKKDTNSAVRLFEGNEMTPALRETLKVIAKHELVLATGHISPEESLLLIEAAQKMGVQKILVTHASAIPVMASVDEQRAMAKKGAFIEHSVASCMPFHSIKMKKRFGIDVTYNTEKEISNILDVGVEHCIVSTDFGQDYNPSAVEGLKLFIRALLDFGLTTQQIKVLVDGNPKKLLGKGENLEDT